MTPSPLRCLSLVLLMAALFESLAQPLSIVVTLPLAFTGCGRNDTSAEHIPAQAVQASNGDTNARTGAHQAVGLAYRNGITRAMPP